jgi:hypothetical protein
MRRPGYVALGRWLFHSSHPRPQALGAMERRRVADDFPLAFLVREAVADLGKTETVVSSGCRAGLDLYAPCFGF